MIIDALSFSTQMIQYRVKFANMLKIVFNCLKSAPDHSLNLIFIIKDFALKIFTETGDLKITP